MFSCYISLCIYVHYLFFLNYLSHQYLTEKLLVRISGKCKVTSSKFQPKFYNLDDNGVLNNRALTKIFSYFFILTCIYLSLAGYVYASSILMGTSEWVLLLFYVLLNIKLMGESNPQQTIAFALENNKWNILQRKHEI